MKQLRVRDHRATDALNSSLETSEDALSRKVGVLHSDRPPSRERHLITYSMSGQPHHQLLNEYASFCGTSTHLKMQWLVRMRLTQGW